MKPRLATRVAAPDAARVAAVFQQAALLHQQGRPFQADALCAELLRADARHYGAWHLRGLIAIEAGRIEQGIRSMERSLQLHPNQPAAHSNIGNALLSQGQPQLALESFNRALQLKADYVAALYNRGNALRGLRCFDEALASYDRVLGIKADHVPALNNRGVVLLELERPGEALTALQQACELEPRFFEAARNQGAALLKLERAREALDSYERALREVPKDPAAWCGRGAAMLALKQPDAALASYTQAIQLDPRHVDGWISRGHVLQLLHRCADALSDYEQALGLAPDSVLALNNSGNALLELGQAQAALARYDRALELSSHAPNTLYNRGAALRELKRYQESAQAFAELLRVAPEHEYALGNLFHLRMDCCDWTDYFSSMRQIYAALATSRRAINPLSLLLSDSPELQLDCARAYVQDKYPPELSSARAAPQRHGVAAPAKIRVAYVSADFREHPVAYLLVGALELHDRRCFELIGISLRAAQDSELGRRVRSAFDRFIEVTDRTDREVAELLRELRVDIAVDLMGFTQGLRLGIFAHRVAPVQVSYLGYAGTTGADFIDYLIADDVVIPAGEEGCYAEQVVRLPYCYLPNDARREIAADRPPRAGAGLPAEGLVFCAFTNTYKINPPVFDIWMRLLREQPGSVLWLRATDPVARDNLQSEAHRRDVAAERLIFAPHLASMAQHLARLSLADLYLDTVPYNAHSTACDALWAGVPVLTCAGRSFASRVAASVLAAAGLPELVTHSLDEYQQRALELARDPAALRALRARLAQNRAHAPLFDTASYTHYLEDAYRTMYGRYMQNLAPVSFRILPGSSV